MGERYLITGAKGHLGLALTELLVSRHGADRVVAADRHTLDLCGDLHLLDEFTPSVVYNCAAYNDVDRAQTDPAAAFAVNALAVGELARKCDDVGAKLVTFSTDHVFSGGNGDAWLPSDRPAPSNAYGASKLAGEQLALLYCPDTLVIRTCGLYGHSKSGKKSFVDAMLGRGRQGLRSDVIDDNLCNPTYVRDLAVAAAHLGASTRTGVAHATNHGYLSWYRFARTAYTIAGLPVALLRPVTTAEWVAGRSAYVPRPRFGMLQDSYHSYGMMAYLPSWQDALGDYVRATDGGRS